MEWVIIMESSSSKCANCFEQFSQGGPRKFPISAKLNHGGFPVFQALSDTFRLGEISPLTPISEKDTRFLCTPCSNALGSAYKNLLKFKERTNTSSYLGKKLSLPYCPDPPEFDSPLPQIDEEFPNNLPTKDSTSKVQTVFESYLNNKKKADILYNCIRRKVNKEVKELVKESGFSQNQLTRQDWFVDDKVLEDDMIKKAPMLYKILNGAALKNQRKLLFNSAMKTAVAVIVHSRNHKANIFQKSVGLTLFKGRSTIKTFDVLKQMGLSTCHRTVQNVLDTLNSEYDLPLKNFQRERTNQISAYQRKTENERTMKDVIDTSDLLPDASEYTIPAKVPKVDTLQNKPSSSRRTLVFESKEVETSNLLTFYSAMFSVDNINHCVKPNIFNSTTKPKVMNMTSAAFIPNRIPQPIDQALKEPRFKKAQDIPESAFIPSESDVNIFRRDHKVLVKRILVKNMHLFKRIQNHESIEWNIPHKYSQYSSEKSEVVCLGIMDIDEGTTEGTKKIMKYIEGYSPVKSDGSKLCICVGGDTLTADFQRSTQHHLSNSDAKDELLNKTVPSVGLFHLRMALLQDIVNLFFGKRKKNQKSNPCPGRGTLPNLRARFAHPDKLRRVKHNFIIAYKFMQFCLVSYVCTYACEILEIPSEDLNNPSEKYKNLSVEELVRLLDNTADEVVDFEFSDITRNTSMDKFCLCESAYDSSDSREYIACDNDSCKEKLWYHVECLRKQTSRDKVTKRFRYQKPPTAKDLSKVNYYCTLECRKACEDKIVLYSKAVINCLLFLEGFRDAIRCNDGLRIDMYSKLHLITFFNKRHPNMLRVCHYWQCNKHGLADGNVEHDLLYNSCVNVLGQKDSNLEMDLFHEHMNDYLKEMILLPCGNSTEISITRRSRAHQILKDSVGTIEGQFRKLNDENTDSSVSQKKHNKKHKKYLQDLQVCVAYLGGLGLFRSQGKRSHENFSDFKNDLNFLDNISVYKEKLKSLAVRLDDAKEYQDEARNLRDEENDDDFISSEANINDDENSDSSSDEDIQGDEEDNTESEESSSNELLSESESESDNVEEEN